MRSFCKLLVLSIFFINWNTASAEFPIPKIEYNPEHYTCFRAGSTLQIDGVLTEESWNSCFWTDEFVDIEGELKPSPELKTRVKMLWDDDYFYIGAEMEEPHLWATITERDAVIFHDNDFEIFIDPNGDTHDYYELEINALGTVWDLFLIKPYRDWHLVALDSWDIQGLRSAVHINGSLNDPADVDQGWSVELAIPWKVLEECAYQTVPPEDGDYWRVNFSRVQWQLDVVNGEYRKNDEPEKNWVWSPQGLINIHYPEMWGFVHFRDQILSEGEIIEFRLSEQGLTELESAKWYLRQIYYQQRKIFEKSGSYSDQINRMPEYLNINQWSLKIYVTPNLWEAVLQNNVSTQTMHIDQDGRTWISDR